MPPKMRDDISNSYFRSLLPAISAVVQIEVAVLRTMNFELDAVYPALVLRPLRQRANPVQWSFQGDIISATSVEVGTTFDPEEFAAFRQSYISTFNSRYIGSHEGQLSSLPSKMAMVERVDDWMTDNKEAMKRAFDEKVRLSSATFRECLFSTNRPVTWHTRGKSCNFCKRLKGKVIWKKDPWFVRPGDAVDSGVEDEPPMKSYSGCGHCPLHASCDCFIA